MDDPLSTSVALDLAVDDESWIAAFGSEDALHAHVRRACEAVFAEESLNKATSANGLEVSALLCDDAAIAILNEQWRQRAMPTNVLSFPAATAMRDRMLGDIVVAFETSRREAEAAGTSLSDYLSHLVVHGLYHLLGHDHENDGDADAMEAAESRALARLGLRSPYLDADVSGDMPGSPHLQIARQ